MEPHKWYEKVQWNVCEEFHTIVKTYYYKLGNIIMRAKMHVLVRRLLRKVGDLRTSKCIFTHVVPFQYL